MLDRKPGDRRKVDYAEVERALVAYVTRVGGAAAAQLAEINPRHRTHPLDAVGVATFAAMRPSKAARIGGP